MHSCIYRGQVRHRRFQPSVHTFQYRLYMMYLDLDELPTLFDRYWLWSVDRVNLAFFDRRRHYGDPDMPLKQCIQDLVEQQCGHRPVGPIRLLTHMRYFGYGFNPVSFYYCFDEQDDHVEHIVAEVNNTPWGEQHCYVLEDINNEGNKTNKRYRFDKRFHVSPFMQMDLQYDWRFSTPAGHLAVHMINMKNNARIFDATMKLQYRAIDSVSLAGALVKYPMMTIKVIAAIYYQALRLWLKKTPFYTHSDNKEAPSAAKDL